MSEINSTDQVVSPVELTFDEKSLLRDARNSGLNIFTVETKVRNSLSREEYGQIPVLKLINKIGMVVLQTPEYNSLAQKPSGEIISCKIVFVTDKNLKELKDPLPGSLLPFEEDLFIDKKEYKILIIEDNPVALLLQRSLMSSFGICDTASDGEKGLDLFKLSMEEKAPYDIILLDLVMPGIKGSEVLKNIRKHEDANNIKGLDRSKVIVSTSTKESATLMELFRAETDAYIIKPLTRVKIEKELINLELI